MSEYLEFQRYGRNKSTIVDHSYISSGEFRRKFDLITDHSEVILQTAWIYSNATLKALNKWAAVRIYCKSNRRAV